MKLKSIYFLLLILVGVWSTAYSQNWLLLGNAGINDPATPATYGTSTIGGTENYVGTTDGQDLVFGTNNKERLRVKQSTGYVGIGTASPSGTLDVHPNFNAASIYFTATSDQYPRINMGGNSSTVAGLFMRNVTGASFYMGADTDTGGYYFRGKGYSDIGSGRMVVSSSNGGTCLGCVGINTTTPKEKLHVVGIGKFEYNAYNFVSVGGAPGTIALVGSGGGINPKITFFDDFDVSTTTDGQILYTDADGMSFHTGGVATSHMRIKTNGKVVIGNPANLHSTSLTNYRLFVEDGIITERIKVAIKSDGANWSDYVFAPDYKLLSLDSVKQFTKNNCHLPGMPSADDVYKEGIDVANMDALLLKQIEELWLQLFILKQENEDLKKLLNK